MHTVSRLEFQLLLYHACFSIYINNLHIYLYNFFIFEIISFVYIVYVSNFWHSNVQNLR